MPSRQTVLAVVALVLLAGLGLYVGNYTTYLLNLAMIAVIAAVGLNLLTGNTGQISLCHSSFMAIGAYASSLLAVRYGVPFWAAIPVAASVAALTGALLGLPASRLHGIYLALATLGFLQIVQIVIEEFADITGGVRGLNVTKPTWLGATAVSEYQLYLIVAALHGVRRVDRRQHPGVFLRARDERGAVEPARGAGARRRGGARQARCVRAVGGVCRRGRRLDGDRGGLHRSDRVRRVGRVAADHLHRRRRHGFGRGLGHRRRGAVRTAGSAAAGARVQRPDLHADPAGVPAVHAAWSRRRVGLGRGSAPRRGIDRVRAR